MNKGQVESAQDEGIVSKAKLIIDKHISDLKYVDTKNYDYKNYYEFTIFSGLIAGDENNIRATDGSICFMPEKGGQRIVIVFRDESDFENVFRYYVYLDKNKAVKTNANNTEKNVKDEGKESHPAPSIDFSSTDNNNNNQYCSIL